MRQIIKSLIKLIYMYEKNYFLTHREIFCCFFSSQEAAGHQLLLVSQKRQRPAFLPQRFNSDKNKVAQMCLDCAIVVQAQSLLLCRKLPSLAQREVMSRNVSDADIQPLLARHKAR